MPKNVKRRLIAEHTNLNVKKERSLWQRYTSESRQKYLFPVSFNPMRKLIIPILSIKKLKFGNYLALGWEIMCQGQNSNPPLVNSKAHLVSFKITFSNHLMNLPLPWDLPESFLLISRLNSPTWQCPLCLPYIVFPYLLGDTVCSHVVSLLNYECPDSWGQFLLIFASEALTECFSTDRYLLNANHMDLTGN